MKSLQSLVSGSVLSAIHMCTFTNVCKFYTYMNADTNLSKFAHT